MATSTNSAALSVLDTNVLVYAHDQDSPHHEATARLLHMADDPDAGLCVTPQTLAEFFAVVTSPKRVNHPRSAEEAVLAIEQLLLRPGITVLPVPADVVVRWMALVRRSPVTRQRVFDLQLAATMLGNGVTRLYTFNPSDFASIGDLELLTPEPR